MAIDSGKQQQRAHNANRKATSAPVDDRISAAGDNRRLGDQDGNKAGGDSKSPGATDPADQSGPAADKRA